MIEFSILIPTLTSRRVAAERLWDKLDAQVKDVENVELLMLRDNKRRTTGAKRQALLDIARGRYIAFVDDDDDVSSDYVLKIMAKILTPQSPDLIVFPIRCTINGGQEGIVMPSVEFVNEPIREYSAPVTFRPPHHLCVWKRDIAVQGRFPDIQHGEDFKWARQVWPLVKSEIAVEECIYHYRWDKNVTEAEPV